MTFTSPTELAKAKAAAEFQQYQSEVDAAGKQSQLVAEADAAMATYREAGHRRAQMAADTVAEFRPRIENEIRNFIDALSSVDDQVTAAKATAQAALRAAGGHGQLTDDGAGGRIANINKLKATVDAAVDLAVRSEMTR